MNSPPPICAVVRSVTGTSSSGWSNCGAKTEITPTNASMQKADRQPNPHDDREDVGLHASVMTSGFMRA